MKQKLISLTLVVILITGIIPLLADAADSEKKFVAVEEGVTTYALTKNGELWGWGHNAKGKLGNVPEFIEYSNAIKIADKVKSFRCTDGYYSITTWIDYDNNLWQLGGLRADYYPMDRETNETYMRYGLDDPANWQITPYKLAENVLAASWPYFIKLDYTLWIAEQVTGFTANYMDQNQSIPYVNGYAKLDDGVVDFIGGISPIILKKDGTVWIWHLGHIEGLSDIVSIDSGATAIQLSSGGGPTFDGDRRSINYLALRADGALFEIDYDTAAIRKVMDDVIDFSVNRWYDAAYAVKKDGTVWGWGHNIRFMVNPHVKYSLDAEAKWYSEPNLIMEGASCVSGRINMGLAVSTNGDIYEWGLLGNLFSVNLYIIQTPEKLYIGNTTKTSANKPSSWAADQVNAAITLKLVPSSLQSKYTQVITRAEYCALAVAFYEKYTGKKITDRNTFDDTTDVNVEKMAAVGVVTGVDNNRFDPDTKLTREQAAVMLARLSEAVGKPLTKRASTFDDNDSISSWATEQVGQVQDANIMTGTGNNNFSPKDPYTREQSIITMIRLWNIVKNSYI